MGYPARTQSSLLRRHKMTLSMYQASVPVFVRMLNNISAILDKAVHHAAQRKIEPSVLLGTRLFPDMFPLLRQVQLTSDFAKGFKPGQIDGSEEREITIPIGGQPHSFKGQAYLLHQAMPNFYFHATA